jgi:hypothetical protein
MAGDFTQALDAQSEMSWRFAADNIAGQIERWARQNYPRLIARRTAGRDSEPQPPSPQKDSAAPSANATMPPGMTTEDVTKALGDPQKKVNFGTKSLWTYKGMQVVFESGKVTDVKF